MVPSYDDVMRMLVPSEKLMLVKMLKLEKEEITKETQDDNDVEDHVEADDGDGDDDGIDVGDGGDDDADGAGC